MPLAAPVVFGNWKMHGLRDDAEAQVAALASYAAKQDGGTLGVFVPATLLSLVAGALRGTGIWVGGQDCHGSLEGAHTGDISAVMLRDAGATAALVGHSERRTDHRETDDIVLGKAKAALDQGLLAVVCVGETEQERDADQTEARLAKQIEGSIPDGASVDQLVVAYEPVWAIGTGRTPNAQQIRHAHQFLREQLAQKLSGGAGVTLLYGGSVKPENAAEILAIDGVDGALVGGASLKPESFLAIHAAGLSG
ncbi:MAG: triose-phosphate isomerase [Geminicoccaceae bacterium]